MSQFNTVTGVPGGGSPAASGVAQTLAASALQRAQLEAQAKLQKEAIASQEKLAKQQLEHESSEHQKYQQFLQGQQQQQLQAQAAENQKTREQQAIFEAHRKEYQDKLLQMHQDAIRKHERLMAAQLRLSARNSNNPELAKTRAQIHDLADQISALDIEGQTAQLDKTKTEQALYHTADVLRQGRIAAHGQAVRMSGDALEGTFRDAEAPTFLQRAATMPSTPLDPGGLGAAIISKLVQTSADYLGGDIKPDWVSAGTQLDTFAKEFSKRAAPQLQAFAKNGAGAGQVQDALENAIRAGLGFMPSDKTMPNAVPNPQSAASQKAFEDAVAGLRKVLPDEVAQGVFNSLGQSDAWKKIDINKSNLFVGESRVRNALLDNVRSLGPAFQYVVTHGSPAARMMPADRDLTGPLQQLMASYAVASYNHDDMMQRISDFGISPEVAAQLLDTYEKNHGQAPEQVMRKIREVKSNLFAVQEHARDIQSTTQSYGLEQLANTIEGGAGGLGLSGDLGALDFDQDSSMEALSGNDQP